MRDFNSIKSSPHGEDLGGAISTATYHVQG